VTAQFVSLDPAVPLTREPYGYATANPLTHSDPTGLMDSDTEDTLDQGNPEASCAGYLGAMGRSAPNSA
jgi:hypothetical protein